ncbi:TRAP transporter small permease [Microbaculum marinum]|uniref:TRAP transporter small permease protein n=1 Tax=Microbaculum marinum TaxID=1764581 RepID=A0AAW9RU97_9HYPH
MRALYAFALKVEAVLAGTFLLLMVALIFTGGVARMLHHPLNWTIDLSTCFFAWACFLCADIAWRRGALMTIDIVPSLASPGVRRALVYANHLIIGVFLAYVIYAGAWLSWVSRARSFQGIPGVSYSWVTMSIVVGGALLLLTTVLKVRTALREDGLLGASPTSR